MFVYFGFLREKTLDLFSFSASFLAASLRKISIVRSFIVLTFESLPPFQWNFLSFFGLLEQWLSVCRESRDCIFHDSKPISW